MFSVLVYFWGTWKRNYFSSKTRSFDSAKQIILATAATGFLGVALLFLLEKVILKDEVESLFGNLRMVSLALASAGLLILFAAAREKRSGGGTVGARESLWIGLVQGLCLPFRGFSRSGATISVGLLLGVARSKAEEFSFALAVVLTPPVLAREIHRLLKAHALAGLPPEQLTSAFLGCLLGMVLSFGAGLLALRWLSAWLEKGRWKYFGYYCLAAAFGVWFLAD
jgi:undecaprenyl-diphosphatase